MNYLDAVSVAWFRGSVAWFWGSVPGFGTEAFFLIFSSMRSSFDRMILIRANTFFVFFGTEAPKA